MDPILKSQLERDEDRRLKAYQDTNGHWTIGVGHLLGSNPRMTEITDAECDALLAYDADNAEGAARRVFDNGESLAQGMWVLLDSARKRALINMAFNRGEKHMQESLTITPAIRAALPAFGPDVLTKWKAVSDAILVSPWAAQIKDRAQRLAKQLETGVDQ